MNKHILVAAVAAAMALPAVALADASIYGRAHLSFDMMDNDASAPDDYSATNISNNSSRIGVRGSHALNEDITGIWQVESNFEAAGDRNNGRLGTRNTFVGLEGGFGRVRVGYSDTVTKGISRATDLFGDQAGDSRNMLDSGDDRFRNALFYDSPKMGGFTFGVNYSTNNDGENDRLAVDGNDTQAYSIGAIYREGPLYVGLGYEQNDVDGSADTKATRLGAYYDMDALRITGLLQMGKDGDLDRNTYGVGIRYTMGKTALKAQYYWTDNDGAATDASMLALGVQYAIARSTSIYLAYAMTDNDNNIDYSPAGGGRNDDFGVGGIGAVPDGASPSIISLGVMHNFKFDL